jgi:hypothetical protein
MENESENVDHKILQILYAYQTNLLFMFIECFHFNHFDQFIIQSKYHLLIYSLFYYFLQFKHNLLKTARLESFHKFSFEYLN